MAGLANGAAGTISDERFLCNNQLFEKEGKIERERRRRG